MKSICITNRKTVRYTDKQPRREFGYVEFFTDNKETFITVPQAQLKINKTDLRNIVSWCSRRLIELEK